MIDFLKQRNSALDVGKGGQLAKKGKECLAIARQAKAKKQPGLKHRANIAR